MYVKHLVELEYNRVEQVDQVNLNNYKNNTYVNIGKEKQNKLAY